MTPGFTLSVVVIVVLVFAVAVMTRRWVLERRAVSWIRARYGSVVSLLSLCILSSGDFRFRGVVGLAGDIVVWRSVHFNRARIGEIHLASVDMIMWEDAGPVCPLCTRRGSGDRLLTLQDRAGVDHRFVLKAGQAILWDKVLEVRLGALPDSAGLSE